MWLGRSRIGQWASLALIRGDVAWGFRDRMHGSIMRPLASPGVLAGARAPRDESRVPGRLIVGSRPTAVSASGSRRVASRPICDVCQRRSRSQRPHARILWIRSLLYADRRAASSHPSRPAIGIRITRSRRTLKRGSEPGRARHSAWRPRIGSATYSSSISDTMLPAGSLNQAMGGGYSRMIPRSSWFNPS